MTVYVVFSRAMRVLLSRSRPRDCLFKFHEEEQSCFFCEACGKGFDYQSKFARHLESGDHQMFVESRADVQDEVDDHPCITIQVT